VAVITRSKKMRLECSTLRVSRAADDLPEHPKMACDQVPLRFRWALIIADRVTFEFDGS